ncbi:phosphatase PAP2 family protein [Streptomyces sp. VRA16 Mangrove soil]|uniref:phosphatase PAP2 family protein n=1 Tax=Streptomyces sp. VRA16 Mangrove soil TaxID=2817434 RepID=UPI001A9DFF80|nr:phosphatase PAP2 family protein [Streptomyces sp. VRA16 Mangrove soil]MBO1335976.1 inositol phosphorylceramide synthase [Streptomyces sp. VRA16 Mangrove soil]
MLWTAAGVATLGFLIALEFAARGYGEPGPITAVASDLVLAPDSGPLLYAGLALTMVVLTWRERAIAAAAAIGIDVVFFLGRLIAGGGLSFGNGALWVTLGCAVVAVTRRTGAERALLLKGVALGLLLVLGHRTGDTWLLITAKSHPLVLDPYVALADHALGNPSWVVGRIVEASSPVGDNLLHVVYGQLPLAAALVGLYQLRNVGVERRFPAHHLVRTFLVIGLLGPAIYMIFPVVGPVYAYGTEGGAWAAANVWPDTLPLIGTAHPIPFDEITPRNCMPSLHTAWAVTLFVHSRKGARWMRWAGTFWLVATLTATLGFGYHYGVDLVAGVVFALTVETAMRAFARGWDRPATVLIGYGAVVFAALLTAYRYLPRHLADLPWLFGPLLLLAMGSVVLLYVRTTRSWDPEPEAPAPRQTPPAKPQPELA